MALAVAQATSVSPTGSTTPPNSVDSANLSFGSATTTGSLIVVATGYFNTTAAQLASEVTDNKSNTYQLSVSAGGAGNTEGGGICYNNNGTRGASHQVTVNPSGASHSIAINLIEVTGQDQTTSTSCFDATTVANANDITSPFTVTAAAAISGNQIAVYLAGIGGGSGSNAVTEPSGYTRVGSYNDAGLGFVFDCAYKINETGTPSPACTWAGTVSPESPREFFATFKEAAGGAAAASIDALVLGLADPNLGVIGIPGAVPETFAAPMLAYSDVGPAVSGDVSVVAYLPVGISSGSSGVTRDTSALVASLSVGAPSFASATRDTTPLVASLQVGPDIRASATRNTSALSAHLPVAPDIRAAATRNADAPSYLPVGVMPYAPATRNATIVGYLPAGIDLRADATRGATAPGYLPAGVVLYAPATRNATAPGYLPVGVILREFSGGEDKSVVAVLYIGLDLRADASRNTTALSGVLPVAITPVSSGGRDALVSAVLPVGTFPRNSPISRDASAPGFLPVGIDLRAGNISRQATIVGHLPAGVDLRAGNTSRTATIAQAYLPAGVRLGGPVTFNLSVVGKLWVAVAIGHESFGPPDANPLVLTWQEDVLVTYAEVAYVVEWREQSSVQSSEPGYVVEWQEPLGLYIVWQEGTE